MKKHNEQRTNKTFVRTIQTWKTSLIPPLSRGKINQSILLPCLAHPSRNSLYKTQPSCYLSYRSAAPPPRHYYISTMRNIHKSPAAALKCLLSILALFTMNLPVVHAWGKDGHEIVANIAYNLLTPQTREAAYNILFPLNDYDFNATGHTSPLAAVANWADKVRFVKYFSWTTPLHYVDVRDTLIPNGCPCTPEKTDNATGTGSSSGEELRVSQGEGQQRECKFVYKRDCAGDLCAVGAIVNFSHLSKKPRKKFSMTTASTSTDKRLRALPVPPQNPYISHNITQRQSLMFLIHIIGDIHQPLHSSRESDRGGNTIPVSFVEEEFPGFRDERLGHAHSQWNLQ